jgi:hypothetical protein
LPKERGLREANAVIAGVRSPPLRGGTSPAWMAVRGKVGDDAEGVFSEGRGLRARMVPPYGCRGISFPPDDEAKGPWPPGHTPRSSPCLPCGRAEPAPPRGWAMQARTALRRKARGWREGGFLGGTHSVRPKIRAGSKPGHVTVTDGLAIGWWPKRSKVWIGAMSSLRACGARPSAGGKPSMDGPAGETPKMTPRKFFRRGLQSVYSSSAFPFWGPGLRLLVP